LHPVDATGKGCCFVKRVFDFLLSACGLLVMLIPVALIALVVYIDDPPPLIPDEEAIHTFRNDSKSLRRRGCCGRWL
jgi:lipopolysaccharide/colanic/teichoic acid biosynthesis glycosyltransferase